MRRFIFSICLIILILTAAFFLSQGNQSEKKSLSSIAQSPTTASINSGLTVTQTRTSSGKGTRTIFIPYWTMGETMIDSSNYDRLVYFGITANKKGIDKDEIGYKSLNNFIKVTNANTKRLLGVRMINTDTNKVVLNDKALQEKIIEQSIRIAKNKGFDGIVLDFEISALGFTNITQSISSFEIKYADAVKKNNLSFLTTIYGDTFARFRPFDVKLIASHTDGIMIMAYDYHKSNGNSGPNFPLKDNQDEGYDFQAMINDFLQQTSPDKITVVFGLFGYDWMVDDKGNSLGQAVSVSDYKIEQKFLNSCSFIDCKVIQDSLSSEKKITYIDADSKYHIVWFEDMHSVMQKTNFLKSKGINAIAYWAYSYF
ncbi:MAG TPA: glycosyl hydrolase family 18 protein [Candidatus Saccharimonadales bacterium]|nr:glycosyl hydrolase family 18 protein [Candidatus Saccharimonadales bacterium]